MSTAGDGGFGGAEVNLGMAGRGGTTGFTSSCSSGMTYLGTIVNGDGFELPDGTAVRAHFEAPFLGVGESATDTLEAGEFDFMFSFQGEGCSPVGTSGGGALYIDVDGDGECSPTADDIFVWTAYGGSRGQYNVVVPLSPSSPRCQGLSYPADAQALAAAQHLCPSVGECLSFCGAPEASASNGGQLVAFCPDDRDAGVGEAEPQDGGPKDASSLDVE